MSYVERVAQAVAAGWTNITVATGPSVHPMCQAARGLEDGPPEGDDVLMGTPPDGVSWGDGSVGGCELYELPAEALGPPREP